jgi:hypothetical protein
MKQNKWMGLLAYVTGMVNQELLLQNEYLAVESNFARPSARPIALVRFRKDPPWPKLANDLYALIMSGLKKGMVVRVAESCPE